MAVSAFSPPDSSWTLCSRLPGGCAMISIPLSSGSFSSSSVRPARPPPNSVLKVSWKLRLMAENASAKRCRVVSSIRLIASAVWAIESTRSLRCVVRNPCRVFELVELLDRHHVDGAQPIDLRAQSRNRFLGAKGLLLSSENRGAWSRQIARIVNRDVTCAVAGSDAQAGVAALVRSILRIVDTKTASIRRGAPLALHLLHFDHDLVQRRLNRVDARIGQMREVPLSGRARDVELGHDGTDRIERCPGVLQDGLLLVGRGSPGRRRLRRLSRTS